MRRQEPRIDMSGVDDLDFEPRRSTPAPQPSSSVDWPMFWAVLLALMVFRVTEAVLGFVLAALAISSM